MNIGKSGALLVLALLAIPSTALAQTTSDSKGADTKGSGVTSVMKDAALTAKVKAALIREKDVKATAINVDTDNGVVTLRGKAGSGAESERAASVARSVEGVLSVKNEIQVGTTGARSDEYTGKDAAKGSSSK